MIGSSLCKIRVPFLLLIGSLLLGSGLVSGRYAYQNQQRVPGLATFTERLEIDGPSEEAYKRNAGDRIMFKCITGQQNFPIFLWQKEGQPLPNDVIKYQLISNGNSFLEIPRTSLRSEGNYTCTVSNEFGIARKVFKLCMIAPGKKEDCPGWWYNWN